MPGIHYRQACNTAFRQLNKIPKNYNGKYAADIIAFRGKVQDRLDTYAKADKEREEERNNNIYIGDSETKVLKLLGEPLRKNKTVMSNTASEQWVYNDKYIYIENGRVVKLD